ncbi:MAG: heme exporter protein D [Halieaceae bacterium]|jgi:heme exporter protein D
MYFETFCDFLLMDGHGFYVWTTYSIAAVVLMVLVYSPVIRKRSILKQVALQQRASLSAETSQ